MNKQDDKTLRLTTGLRILHRSDFSVKLWY